VAAAAAACISAVLLCVVFTSGWVVLSNGEAWHAAGLLLAAMANGFLPQGLEGLVPSALVVPAAAALTESVYTVHIHRVT
jgi:hypothetical protein